MGVVYEAEHVETGVRVALKRILPQLLGELSSAALTRFRREAQLSAQLRHPGIVTVHAAELEGSRPYLVQALVGGGSLEERVDRDGPLSEEQVRHLGLSLASALTAAHDAGVLHRDLKPGNVLFNERDEPCLTDFGLAVRRGDGMTLTATGEVVGSPAYMAPEQAVDSRSVDARADVYGLGAILYFALTGQAPFTGVGGVVQILHAVVHADPQPVGELRAGLSPWLGAVVLRAMHKDSQRRYASAAELSAALDSPAVVPAAGVWRWALAALGLVLVLAAGAAWAGRPVHLVRTVASVPVAPGSPAAPALADFEARLFAGLPPGDSSELDSSDRARLEALSAALRGDMARANAALAGDADYDSRRERGVALGILQQAQEKTRAWSDLSFQAWALTDVERLLSESGRLGEEAGGLGEAARRGVQRAGARYLMFAAQAPAEELLDEKQLLGRLVDLSQEGVERSVFLAALSWRLGVYARRGSFEVGTQKRKRVEGRAAHRARALFSLEPPPQDRLQPQELICVALLLIGQAAPPPAEAWRDAVTPMAEGALELLSGHVALPLVSHWVSFTATLRRQLMERYREQAWEEILAGRSGGRPLRAALRLAEDLTELSDSFEAGITFLLGARFEAAARAVGEARAHQETDGGRHRADVDYLEAELLFAQGRYQAAAVLLAPYDPGLGSGAGDDTVPAEVYTLGYHLGWAVDQSLRQNLLELARDSRRLGVPWRDPVYTQRLTEDPALWWPGHTSRPRANVAGE